MSVVSKSAPSVSLIIPARNAAGTIGHALDSIEGQTYSNIVDVVVAAADETTASAAEGRAKVIANPSGKTPTGLNLAIGASNGEVVVRCDAQSLLPRDYVEVAIETMARSGADVVGGMQVPVGTNAWEKAVAAAMRSRWGAGDARYRVGGEEGPVETVYLGVFRRRALERVDGFDEDFLRTQDYELNHRIIASGGVVWFNPALRVEYRPRGTLRELAMQYLEYGQSKRQFNRKHPGALIWRQMAAPALVLLLGSTLVTSFWWPLALVVPGLYLGGLLLAGLTSGESPWRVALALGTIHLAWGLGFLWGKR